MSDPLAPVTPGDPIPDSAATYNALFEAARAVRSGRLGRPQSDQLFPGTPSLIVNVWNRTGLDQKIGNILAVNDSPLDPDESRVAVWGRPILQGTVPQSAHDSVVILAAPLEADGVGPAWLQGVAWCRVSGDGGRASPVESETGYLTADDGGAIRVIRRTEPEEGAEDEELPAIVLLNGTITSETEEVISFDIVTDVVVTVDCVSDGMGGKNFVANTKITTKTVTISAPAGSGLEVTVE